MPRFSMNEVAFEIPNNWQDQGMITFTLPSADKNIKPNVIVTKERLAQPIGLKEYFQKIKDAVAKRGIRDFKIEDERAIEINNVPAMMMVCKWDVSAMKQMLGNQQEGQPQLDNIQPGQMVKQVQVSMIHDGIALNMTASFPADQFDIYFRPFQQFLNTVQISAKSD